MTPLRFEELHQADWQELETLVARMLGREPAATRSAARREPVRGERVAALYRRACEHLAIARARAYPAYLLDRLEQLTADAHQVIYQQRALGLAQLRRLVAADFPQSVRAHARYVWVAAAVFLLPAIAIGCLVYFRPELILSVVGADAASSYEQMYSTSAEAIGRLRTADTDWAMLGFYVHHNISIAFQCFAGGLLAGLGSLFYLALNGAFGGAIAGYLTALGLSSTFYPFIATHSAFELTATVLSGAAGLRIGHALLAPGSRTRAQALVVATRESVVILYGVIALLLIAAAVEAFWSSAVWLPASAKYGVAAACWIAVLSYLSLQGRRGD